MHDYDTQKWFDLYRRALLELERAAITGRIWDARAEITTRLETLQQHPDLHHAELSAIQDALTSLRVLEREEERLAAEDKKRILQQTVQRLQTIAPKFGEPRSAVTLLPEARLKNSASDGSHTSFLSFARRLGSTEGFPSTNKLVALFLMC